MQIGRGLFMGIIFVAGVHGIGKTSCCSEVAKLTGYTHHAASSIIKMEKTSAIAEHSKEVRDVMGNQELLIQGVQKLYEAGNVKIILDGHFTILNSQGQIETVDLAVFAELKMDGVVAYRDDPQRIANRLRERDGRECCASTIAAQQCSELEQAQLVATSLQVPIAYLDAFDIQGLIAATGTIWAGEV